MNKVCLRYIIVNTLHKGENKNNNYNINNNSNNNNNMGLKIFAIAIYGFLSVLSQLFLSV
jgi:hypothetical protein